MTTQPGQSNYEPLLQFFAVDGSLSPRCMALVEEIGMLAQGIVQNAPRNPERTIALRKLIDTKDAIVRTFIAQ